MEVAYVVYILVYIGVTGTRLWIMKGLLNFPVFDFVREVVFRIILVSATALILPSIIIYTMPQSFIRLVVSMIVTVMSVSVFTFFLGLTNNERNKLTSKAMYIMNGKLRKH